MGSLYYVAMILIFLELKNTVHSDAPLFQYRKQRSAENHKELVTVEIPASVLNDAKYRIDCAPDVDEYRSFCSIDLSQNQSSTTTNQSCVARGCVWDFNPGSGIASCYIPIEKGGYGLTGSANQLSDAVTQYTLTRLSKTPNNLNGGFSMFDHDVQNLDVKVSISGPQMIRMTVRDANTPRYEVPVPIQWNPSSSSSYPPMIQFQMTNNSNGQAGFRIQRTETRAILFDTAFFPNGFLYDDQFIQVITTIPSRSIYGFGENTHPSFQHNLKESYRYSMFARDQWPTGENENLYGVHPFYMVIEPNGKAYGVFIFNSNAQDYKFDEFDSDEAMLTYRTVGGIFDVFFFAGPTPEDVIRQYQSVIGKPYMPPYWALGFQLSRYGYNSLTNMKAAMQRTLDAKIPLDIMYGDIDYFRDQLDFTWNLDAFAGLPEYVEWLHDHGMKFITILDPAINSEEKNYPPYIEGQKNSIWIKWPARKNLQANETADREMLGYVWPLGKTAFPDFFYPPTNVWWRTQILEYYSKLKFDGLWVDMNEPANFDTNRVQPWNWNSTGNRPESWNLHCPISSESMEKPPYKTAICGDYLSDKTLCMIAEQTNGQGKIYSHYDVHNLYGWSEIVSSLSAARATENKRSVVISRSTFPTSGASSGHWLGDNASRWPHLKYNLIGMLEFNLFGIPYIGADICGYFHNVTEQMCQRWMQLGAFNPFFRNHNGFGYIDQDPGIFSPDAIASNRHAVEVRYTLIPYLYTLFHRVHISGGTVVRSMAHVFPTIPECWPLDEQFLWGSSLLIAPVIYEDHTDKTLYLPTTERWFDYYTGEEQTALGSLTVSAPYNFTPVYVRGGSIIPHQQSAMNTVASRKKPLYLIIALDSRQTASGDLFWDDGDSIDTYANSVYNYFIFNYNSNRLTLEPWTYKYPQMGNETKLEEIQVFGVAKQPVRVVWNGQDLTPTNQWTFDTTKSILSMKLLSLNMAKVHKFSFL